MAVLLVAMSVMAVMMTVAMPVWKQMAQREKEQELIFRGQQYARAIGLFQRKYANTPPPTLDVLVQEHFLRKKYKDPITNADFVPIPAAAAAGVPARRCRAGGPRRLPRASAAPARPTGGPGDHCRARAESSVSRAQARRSRFASTTARRSYNQWRFVYTACRRHARRRRARDGRARPARWARTAGWSPAGRRGPFRGRPTAAARDRRGTGPAGWVAWRAAVRRAARTVDVESGHLVIWSSGY